MAIIKVKNKQVVVTTDFDFGGNKISNLSDPTVATDGVTLGYLTGNTATVTDPGIGYLLTSDGTSTGILGQSGITYSSGTTTFTIQDDYTFQYRNNYGIDLIARSDSEGNVSWIPQVIKSAANALTISDAAVIGLGGDLSYTTDIDLNSNELNITNQNPPFMIGDGFDNSATGVVEQSDGKIIIIGDYEHYSGETWSGITRLNSDGSSDSTYVTGSGFYDISIGVGGGRTIGIQSDDKVVVGGGFETYDGVSYPSLVRLNTDGSYDTTFAVGAGFSGAGGLRTLIIQDNGKILMGGEFTTYQGVTRNYLLKTNSDATIDYTFDVGTAFSGNVGAFTTVLAMVEQTDGKFVIGGDFTSYDGNTSSAIVRINSDGSYDDTFNVGAGFNNRVYSLSYSPDGKILVVGDFTSYSGTTVNRIVRLDSDGSIDSTFDIGTGFNDAARRIYIQTNGKYLVGGAFTTYDGDTANDLVRLNTDGSIDTTFDAGVGFATAGSQVSQISLLSNGKYVIVGNFTTYKGTSVNRIVRINQSGDIDNQELNSMITFNGEVIVYGGDYSTYINNYDYALVDKNWVASYIVASGATTLVDLTDTNITSQAQGQLLTYDSDTSKWVNSGTIEGDVTIIGDLYVSGTTVTINVADLNIADNIILVNSGETGAGVTLINAGMEVDRGTLTNYQFVFNETDDAFKVGEVGSLQIVATRQDSPTNTGLAYWNNTASRFDTSASIVFDGTDLFLSGMTSGTEVNAVFFNTTTGKLTYGSATTGSVTSVGAGDGMNFTAITSTGNVTLGIPSPITNISTDGVTSVSHTHSITASSLVTGNDGIIVTSNQFKLDDTYINNQTLPELYSYTGITSDKDIGSLPSGQTLGMVYITNNGTVEAIINLGTTASGNEISPYTPVTVASGETVSVTVNVRLSSTADTPMYVNADSWTNVNIDVEWAHISYQNASIGGGTGSVTEVTSTTTDQLTIANPTTAPVLTVVTGAVADSGTALATGNQIYDFVTGLGYISGNDIALSATTYSLYYDPTTSGVSYAEGGSSSGGGGFLGTVTRDSAEPSNLVDKQWVLPEPESDGTYEYTFDNFLNVSSNGITVNLSLETVMLKYYEAGDYWIKESFNKPLASGKTWIGSTNDVVSEIEVVEEWDNSSGVTDIGQKYDQQVQTLMKSSAIKTTIIQNFVFVENIDLTTAANTVLINSETGKKLLIKSIKLILLNSMTPTDSITVNVGTNSPTYNNVVNAQTLDDVLVDEYYDLTLLNIPSGSDGAIVSISSVDLYFRVSTGSTSTPLSGHILLEGFIY